MRPTVRGKSVSGRNWKNVQAMRLEDLFSFLESRFSARIDNGVKKKSFEERMEIKRRLGEVKEQEKKVLAFAKEKKKVWKSVFVKGK